MRSSVRVRLLLFFYVYLRPSGSFRFAKTFEEDFIQVRMFLYPHSDKSNFEQCFFEAFGLRLMVVGSSPTLAIFIAILYFHSFMSVLVPRTSVLLSQAKFKHFALLANLILVVIQGFFASIIIG